MVKSEGGVGVGDVTIEIPAESEIVNHFSADKEVSVRYRAAMLKWAFKPLSLAEKVGKEDLLIIH